MASAPMFPGTGPFAGPSVLDGPPPPGPPEMGGGGGGPLSMRGLAGPQPIPSGQLPPEILTGVTSAAQTINQMLDGFAQVTPNKGPQLALIKDLLQQYLAELMGDGAGATAPTATGPAFPGGGMDRGLAGPGAV
jgi:hypothetical protein